MTQLIELLVLSGSGVRWVVIGHYGTFTAYPSLQAAVSVAREKLASGHARAFVALRIEAEVIDGVLDLGGESRSITGTDRELARFEVYSDRVALVPLSQGGLHDAQKAKVLALAGNFL